MTLRLGALCAVLFAPTFAGARIGVQGTEGDAVTVTCSHAWAGGNRKYFCRDPCGSDEDVVIDSDKQASGRYQLSDTGNVFTVTVHPLQISDTGTYWCAVDRALRDTYSEVVLTVLPAPQMSPSAGSSSHCPSPTLVPSPGTTAWSSTTTHVTVLASTSQAKGNSEQGWQLYLLVSLGVIMMVSLVGSLTFMALYYKSIWIKSQCCSERRQLEVTEYTGSPVTRNQDSISHNTSLHTSPDYENVLPSHFTLK